MDQEDFVVPERGPVRRGEGARRIPAPPRPLPSGSRFGEALIGEAHLLRNVWHLSLVDMLLKALLFVLYAAMWFTHIVYAVPLVAHASIVTPILYFTWAYVLAAFATVVAVIGLLDTYDVGLHLSGRDAMGTPEIASFRDRSFNLMASGVGAVANLLVAIYWTIWYAGNTNITTVGDLVADPYVSGQYFGLAALSFAVYFVSPAFLAAASYASTRYAFGVALADKVVARLGGGSLRTVLEPDV